MILSAQTLINEGIVITNGKGKPAQVGYDLTVKNIELVLGGGIIADQTIIGKYDQLELLEGQWQLVPGNSYKLTFEQGCNIPNGYAGFIHHRSSCIRNGLWITSGVFDPGYISGGPIGAFAICTAHIAILQGARVAQMVVHQCQPSDLYDGQYQLEASS